MANHQLIINPNPVIINLPTLHRAFGEPANHQPIINRFAAIISPTAGKRRHVAQPICRQFADHSWKFADSADLGFVESTDNLPIFSDNLPILARAEFRNPSIIHRRFGPIHRSGCRNRSVESSDNRQLISGNRQIDSPVDRPSGPRNHQLIVNRFPVIVNSAAWNLSPIHHQNAEIYHRADKPPAIRLRKSSDNHPINSENHPTESANLPIIYRRILVIYRSDPTKDCPSRRGTRELRRERT